MVEKESKADEKQEEVVEEKPEADEMPEEKAEAPEVEEKPGEKVEVQEQKKEDEKPEVEDKPEADTAEEAVEAAAKPEGKAEAKEAEKAAEKKPRVTKAELLKMPLPKLREVALGIKGLEGVHGMTKDELTRKVAEHYNIDLSDRPGLQVDSRAIKTKIRELRPLLTEAREKGDKKKAEILRKRIKRLKRKIRWR